MAVGIDIGGTKTHIARRDAQGIVHDTVMPSNGWRRDGLFGDQGNASRLAETIRELGGGADSDALVIGAHGCDTPEHCARFARQMRSVYGGDVTVVNDAQLLVPAAGHDAGVAVIVGTGSIVVGSSPTDSMLVSGGHGWLFGDPGSAPGLVREAVRLLLTRRDQAADDDVLGRLLTEFFGVDDVTGLIYALSVAPEIGLWGSAAHLVFDAADSGSTVAITVIDDAARELAADVANVYRRGALGTAIVCAGGVVTNQPRLFEALRCHIAALSPDSTVELLRDPPVQGALTLADEAEQTRRKRSSTPRQLAHVSPSHDRTSTRK